MSEPRLQHSSEELKFVAELLEFLNRESNDHNLSLDGTLTLWWCDMVMGKIAKVDVTDPDSSWGYYPTAEGDKPESAE